MANWIIWLIQSVAHTVGAFISRSEGKSLRLVGFMITGAVMFALLACAEIVAKKTGEKKRALKVAYSVVILLAVLTATIILLK